MIKRISALLISITIILSLTACQMPNTIFPDSLSKTSDDETDISNANIYDFTFGIGEHTFSLPVNFSAMSARGWRLEEAAKDTDQASDDTDADTGADENEDTIVYNAETPIAPGEYSDYVKASSDDGVVELKFYNDTGLELPLKSCLVVGIKLSTGNSELPEVKLSGEIKLGDSYDDVIDVYGKPSFEKNFSENTGELTDINDIALVETDENEAKTRVVYYSITETSFVEVKIGSYNGINDAVVCITIENDTPVEEEYDYSKDKKKAPDVLELYKEPNLLGKTFSDFAFKYESNLYTLPIPVSELVDDGWTFVRGAALKVQRGNTEDGVVMRKGNLAMSLLVHNYDTKKVQTPINCYAVSLSACVVGPNVDIMLPKGITLGSDENALRNILGLKQIDYENQDDDGNVIASEDDTQASDTNADAENAENDDAQKGDGYVEQNVFDEYTVYSYIMPDDVPTVQLPVSITDVGDLNTDLLGEHRKRIDVYVSNSNHQVVYIYMQNCPEYIVDEAAIWEQQLKDAEEAENN